jgi:hypothetical protein
MSLNSDFIISRLISHSFSVNIGKFRANTYYSVLFKNTGQLCYGFGWTTEAIILTITAQFQLVECYKALVADLGKPLASLNSQDSLFFDECPLSSSGGPISLQDWELVEADATTDVLGGQEGDGVGCWSFAQWTEWAPYVAQMGYNVAKAMQNN